jgi:hypothetical protein
MLIDWRWQMSYHDDYEDDYGQEFYEDYEDDYDDEWYDEDKHDDYPDVPVPIMGQIKNWLTVRWWRIRARLGLPTPFDDIPF